MATSLLDINEFINEVLKFEDKKIKYLQIIIEVFNHETINLQYKVNQYKIDLYFPDHNIAVECDEYDHNDRNQIYEQTREDTIKQELGCIFYRFNPDESGFSILKVLNGLIRLIYLKEDILSLTHKLEQIVI